MSLDRLAAAVVAATIVSGCGLPHGGVETVDEATVPYHLLDDPSPSQQEGAGDQPSLSEPQVYWVDETERLIPRTAPIGCPGDVAELVDALLSEITTGPADEVRDQGLGTALPPESGLTLTAVQDGVAVVDIQPASQIGADRLPIAIGQLVLTVTSAPAIDQVELLSNGEAVQIPVAGGALTDSPVTAQDYAAMVPSRYRNSAPFIERAPGTLPCSTDP
jgi:hypothetical protein